LRFVESVKLLFEGDIEQKSIALSDPGIYNLFGVLPSQSGAIVTGSTALHVPAVLHAVRLIAETIGSLPCKLYRDEDGSKTATKDHPAYRLVHRRANPWTSAGQLRIPADTPPVIAAIVRAYTQGTFDLPEVRRRMADAAKADPALQAIIDKHLAWIDEDDSVRWL